jgi:prolyl oligopeptidase
MATGATAHAGPPAVAIQDVVETRTGLELHDPYRWLETAGSASDAFFRAQGDYARAQLDALPGRARLRARLGQLDSAVVAITSPTRAGGRVFYYKLASGAAQRALYVRDATGSERLLVDPAALGDAQHHVALDWFTPSPDGARVAYGTSVGGGEDSTLHVVDTATGKVLPDAIAHTQYATLAWRADRTSFFYWRESAHAPGDPPADRYRNSRVFLHVLGTDAANDPMVFGPGIAGLDITDREFPLVFTFAGSPWALAAVTPGVKPELDIYVTPAAAIAPGKSVFAHLAQPADAITSFDVHGDDAYFLTHARSSRFEVVHLKLPTTNLAAADVVVPASDRVITQVAAAADALYVAERDGSVGRLLRVPYGGRPVDIALPGGSGVPTLSTIANEPGALVSVESWTEPRRILRVDGAGSLDDLGLQPVPPGNTSDLADDEVLVPSTDGAKVPLSIIHMSRFAKDGSHPTLVDGYGAYGISNDPLYDPTLRAWLERGGVFAVAHVRGGGEYGEDWHQAGREQTKQHTIDDFIACSRYLVEQKYTSPAHLAGEGTSAGGVLIGGAITQHPELYAAALVRVGAVNLTRFETTPGGPANVPEFGSVATDAGFKALYAADAYLHVRDGVAYPAVMLTTGAQDPRVPPWMPGKLAARLQHATSSGKPVLLRVDYDAGHGLGSTRTQHLDDIADEWAFLLSQIASPPPAPPKPPAVAIHDVTETTFGITTHDPYRWLETDGSDSDAYFHAQDAFARAQLAPLPGRDELRARLDDLDNAVAYVSEPSVAGDKLFFFRVPPFGEQRAIWFRSRDDRGAQIMIVDPRSLADADQHPAIDWMQPSPDGSRVAFGVSHGGSEDSTLHVYDLATKKVLPDAISRTQYATLTWRPDNRSFFYWREQPRDPKAPPEERYFDAKTYLHVLGTDPDADEPVFGHGVAGLDPPHANWEQLTTFTGSPWAIASDVPGVEPEAALYVAPLASVHRGVKWTKLADHADAIVGFDVHGNDFYGRTHVRASRGEVIHLDLRHPDLATADIVVPASDRVITQLAAATDALYISERDGAIGHVLRLPYGSSTPTEIALPFSAGVPALSTDEGQPGCYLDFQSWTEARRIYRYDPRTGKLADTMLQAGWPTSNADIVAQEVEVASADGTAVPLSILSMRGASKDGSHPALLTAYGAYGESFETAFEPLWRAWFERGGVVAVAHVRGGGERGEDWHRGGQLANKQHSIDDFVASAQYLIANHYTAASRLGIEGTSAGGVVMGGAITQHPELFAAAIIRVGDVNMTRHEHGASGPANVPEFGTAATADGFKSLYAMDAYQHVRDGVAYPAVLLTTGVNDPRVPSWMPGKMAARLQHATTSGKPVLLRVDYQGGHGFGTTREQYLDEVADDWSFLFDELE